ncbi:MAG: phenylalanine--tRNA ligase subunit beta [Bryobacteraceae bacterium]|jgi:phenylalanyl-tRNA synthetase beta chain
MKFSYHWIKELVDGLDANPRELTQLITMKTAECEGTEEVGAALREASAALILAVEPIEGSHNLKALVETAEGTKSVVCGAPNCWAGMYTAWLPVGRKVVAGVESDGMLASGVELGITRDHAGIVKLDSSELALTPDTIIEVDNKSLTHRPDLWGHHGMAREVAAITGKPLRDPADLSQVPHGKPAIGVEIDDLSLCPRYSALVFENVTVQPSPLWLQYRLESIGLNSINNIVDVTNFVMAAIAQPMHAFDARKLHGPTIFIRPAREGESITALNDERYDLAPSNLVIADAAGPVAIAGVIGGLGSAIGPGTTRIVLESANFHPASVRRTSVALKLRTDASVRFEKSQDPVNTLRGIAMAIALFREVSPGIRVVGGVADALRPLTTPPPIELSLDWLKRKLGREVEQSEVESILTSLGFKVTSSGRSANSGTGDEFPHQQAPEDVRSVAAESRGPSPNWTPTDLLSVAVPSWRATKDVTVRDDLVEEVGRMLGYGSITPCPPMIACAPPPSNPARAFEHGVRQILADEGFTEVYNYSFVTEEEVRRLSMNPDHHVRVANPIVADQQLMRSSLLPGILRNIETNNRNFPSFRWFEIGTEIHKRETGLPPGLPNEKPHVVAAMYSRDGDGVANLFELKRVAECLMRGCVVEPAQARPFEHPQRAANVLWHGETVGRLFELHPALVSTGRAAILDADLACMRRLAPATPKYEPLRRFPVSSFDLSVVAAARALALDVQKQLAELAGASLVAIEFVREYMLTPEQRSVSFRITVGAPGKTLSSDEVGAIRQRIIDGMTARGYELRL